MTNSTKIIISIVGVGVIGAAAYILIRRYKNKNRYIPPTIPNGGGTNGTPPSSGGRSDEFPLKQGSKGARVKALQTYMNITRNENAVSSAWGFKGCNPKLVVDGDWGPLTQACYKTLRKVYNPEVDKAFYDKANIKSYE